MFASLTVLSALVFLLGHGHAAYDIRWCTKSEQEQNKCKDFKVELEKLANDSKPSCVQAANAIECMKKIQDGDADLITLDGGEIYRAGKMYGMVPVVAEDYGSGSPLSYYAVAVVKKNTGITIKNLEDRNTCHTGAGKTAGWVVPIGTLMRKGYMKQDSSCNPYVAAGKYFKESCIPNVKLPKIDTTGKNPNNLCALCKDECSTTGNYSGYSGAFRCLVDGAGEVAFVKHTTVSENKEVQAADYRYLCKDGTIGEIGQHITCSLAKVPSHAVMTKSGNNNKAKYVSVLLQASNKYSNDSGSFTLFDSTKWGTKKDKDLLFKDSTVELKDVSQQTYQEFLGDDYMNDLKALEDCVSPTAGSNDNKPYLLASVVFSLVALVLSGTTE